MVATASSPSAAPTKSPTPKPVSTSAPTAEIVSLALRINCGSYSYADPVTGLTWSEDVYHVGGSNYTVDSSTEISGTDNDPLYHSEQYGNFSYEIPVLAAPRTYEIVLHFAEIYFMLQGKRVFDVSIEGENVLDDLDLYHTDSEAFIARRYVFQQQISDGAVSIDFVSVVDNAKVSGIEVNLVQA